MWVSIQDGGLIKADVIRWKEGVYKPRRSRKAKAVRLGEWLVSAEVLQDPDVKGWMRLLVRKCEILSELSIKSPPPMSSGTEIKRAKKTILRGKAELLFVER